MTMPGWYDIMGFADLSARNDEVGIKHSQAYIHSLVEAEISSGIPSTRIVLCGFSQGGAISLFSGLTSPKPLGGIVGLSCYLLLHDTFKKFIPQDDPNRETPIFMGHGDIDSLVLPKWGQMSKDMLSADGYKVDLKFYKGLGHSADPEEIDDVEKYLNERIPPLEDKQAL
ncbi:putative phospholipase [Calycina marina]|uniref:Acyl-protein thioesterase 1 n=1 Tax=Calycina marina TaxID=1763456 RepID=A0A9P8CI00_9HELO|nr:putative phospholipase [Calycina marina]